ncbi:hypothetical protein ACIQVE_01555 [Pseudomonas sp. NPDC098747]|uniref:hypothetical protein n=1 Tax=Pseudomonas sp. NPDC098747 TaxID=3364487 RepID=UPI003839DC5A
MSRALFLFCGVASILTEDYSGEYIMAISQSRRGDKKTLLMRIGAWIGLNVRGKNSTKRVSTLCRHSAHYYGMAEITLFRANRRQPLATFISAVSINSYDHSKLRLPCLWPIDDLRLATLIRVVLPDGRAQTGAVLWQSTTELAWYKLHE